MEASPPGIKLMSSRNTGLLKQFKCLAGSAALARRGIAERVSHPVAVLSLAPSGMTWTFDWTAE